MIQFNIYSILKVILGIGLLLGFIFNEIIMWNYFILAIGTTQEKPYSTLGIATFVILNVIFITIICAYIDLKYPHIFKNIDNYCKRERTIKFK